MDDGFEALVGFVGSHGNTLELLELAEEVLDEMAPFVHFGIERQRLGAARMLGDDDLCAALVEVSNDGVAIEGLVGDQCAEIDPIDEWRDADRIEPVAGQQNEAHEIAERICPTIPARCSLIAPIAEAVLAMRSAPRAARPASSLPACGDVAKLRRLNVSVYGINLSIEFVVALRRSSEPGSAAMVFVGCDGVDLPKPPHRFVSPPSPTISNALSIVATAA